MVTKRTVAAGNGPKPAPARRRAPANASKEGRGGSTAKKKPVRPYHHGNLREELIRLGKARLQEQDDADLSLRRVAADAGVSQVAPKHHFGNKDGLLAAIAASGFRDLTEFRFSRLKPHMNAEQRLRVLLSSYVVFATLNPALFRLMFAPQFQTTGAYAELDEAASQSFHMLARASAEFLKDKRKDGGAPAIAAEDVARYGWTCMHGLATLMIQNRFNPVGASRYTREQLMNRTLDLVFAGIQSS